MSLQEVRLDAIAVSGTESQKARRQRFKPESIAELADSIKAHGILQPIVVRYSTSGSPNFELVAGERRFLAATAAGLERIPANVLALTDDQVVEVQLIENLQREDVHPMEEAEAYQQLIAHGHPVDELHARVGKSRSYVYGRLKLLALCKAAREAFYAGDLSASIALIIARIPSENMQEEALEVIRDDRMPVREAQEWVQREFMLRLDKAPFPLDDETLPAKSGTVVGPCTTCRKRTGNQPELFADIASADVCTDTECYKGKVQAFGTRILAEARERGQRVIEGKEAAKVAPRGADRSYVTLNGWHRLDEQNYNVGKTIRQIVGRSVERALLQCPLTGSVVEVVSAETVRQALKEKGTTSARDPYKAAQGKARIERKYRRALYAQVRPVLPAPTPQAIAEIMLSRLHHETLRALCDVREFEAPTRIYFGSKSKDYAAIGKGLATWTDAAANELINDMIYVAELTVSPHQTGKPARLLDAAKAAGIDATAIRRTVTASKKISKKKPAKKKRAPKKATSKKASKRAAG